MPRRHADLGPVRTPPDEGSYRREREFSGSIRCILTISALMRMRFRALVLYRNGRISAKPVSLTSFHAFVQIPPLSQQPYLNSRSSFVLLGYDLQKSRSAILTNAFKVMM